MALKTAILGGSFDPVHEGHLHLLGCVLRMTDYQRIILVPAYVSNFKQDSKSTAGPAQRLEMLRLALLDFLDENREAVDGRQILIDDLEIRKGGVSYTKDTVESIREKYQVEERLGLIVGDDHLPRLHEWYGFDSLSKMVVFLVFRRLGLAQVAPEGAQCLFMDNEIFPCSATEFRGGVRRSGMLSPRVAGYVRENGLYD